MPERGADTRVTTPTGQSQMPGRSLSFVGVTYLDGSAIARLRELAEALVTGRQDVLAVYLFGSLPRGTYAPGSDGDLLIVLREDRRRLVDRMPEFLRAFLEAPVPVDVFPFTAQELAEKQKAGNTLVKRALQEGVLLAAQEAYPTAQAGEGQVQGEMRYPRVSSPRTIHDSEIDA